MVVLDTTQVTVTVVLWSNVIFIIIELQNRISLAKLKFNAEIIPKKLFK